MGANIEGIYNARKLCEKITELYPEIGTCGIDIEVNENTKEKTWVVSLKSGTHSLDHFLEYVEADQCMDGKQCVSLGLEIAQLKKNITGNQF